MFVGGIERNRKWAIGEEGTKKYKCLLFQNQNFVPIKYVLQ